MVYFWPLRFILTKYGRENNDFFRKIGKKGILLTFLAHKPYNVGLAELTFFLTKYGHGTRGFFKRKIEKK